MERRCSPRKLRLDSFAFLIHSVKAAGLRSWNKETIEEMVKDLSPLCGDLNTRITETNGDILDNIDGFVDSASEFQQTQGLVRAAIISHLDEIRDTFDIVRDGNAAMECKSDLAFRKWVEEGVKVIQDEIEKIDEVLPF
ncbi:hypothetical protein E0Z10_g6052 [Xylaria hypoxylon]|uniref:DUF7605 domain-containing protein n=1 Tax=Xylaria hypoxylon TaxID=37992 RepID=A0A4Z0YZH1_9PEZI|nr:hypothetical protein E0Z10_g6052 [Xylaria hypoxylon]